MMSVALTASKLRENVYRILDQVLETGIPVEIERGGQLLRIVAVDSERGKLSNLEHHPDTVTGDLDDLDQLDWSDEWTG